MIYTIGNQAAMEALRSVNTEDVPSILKPIAFFTRFQARMVTQLMPLFAPTNMLRDVAERSENIRTRKIAGHAGLDMNKVANQAIGESAKLLMKLKPVMMGVLAENTPLAKLFPVDNANDDVIALKQFLALGGSSTYGDMLSGDSKSLAEKLRKTGTISDKAMEAIELWNNSFELISGFSIYKSLVANGVGNKDAATASLNLMNFRKRGKVMSPLRALYMFAQPIATGGHQMAMTLSTRRGQVRYAAYTVAAMALYAMLRSGDDDDELGINKMDELGNFTLYRNIPIPMGNGMYFKVPVGFGMQQLAWSHGVNAVRTMLGDMTAGEAVAESAALWARSAMPVSPAETSMLKNPMVWLAQTFSPQVAKPLVNIALDVNSFGAPLTNARYERQDMAKSLQGRRDTPQIYKDISRVFAQNGIDFYPE
ncbi:MAG: LPD38 domain-containing protein [Methylococcales bacterium]|nr:LPD38 domain-containing protein [Methylococcales bacterium]MDP3840708.1 LPD38 domain-containing protein [Methylococcales bacterium]